MYSYSLYEFKVSESVYDENTGNWSASNEEWVFVSKCRDETNGGGQKVNTTDSQVYIFGAIIYLPKNCPEVTLGAKVRVLDEKGNVRIEGENLLWKKEKYHARLWL